MQALWSCIYMSYLIPRIIGTLPCQQPCPLPVEHNGINTTSHRTKGTDPTIINLQSPNNLLSKNIIVAFYARDTLKSQKAIHINPKMVSLPATGTPWSPSYGRKENRYFGSRNHNKPAVGRQPTDHNNKASHLCDTHHIISTYFII